MNMNMSMTLCAHTKAMIFDGLVMPFAIHLVREGSKGGSRSSVHRDLGSRGRPVHSVEGTELLTAPIGHYVAFMCKT